MQPAFVSAGRGSVTLRTWLKHLSNLAGALARTRRGPGGPESEARVLRKADGQATGAWVGPAELIQIKPAGRQPGSLPEASFRERLRACYEPETIGMSRCSIRHAKAR